MSATTGYYIFLSSFSDLMLLVDRVILMRTLIEQVIFFINFWLRIRNDQSKFMSICERCREGSCTYGILSSCQVGAVSEQKDPVQSPVDLLLVA